MWIIPILFSRTSLKSQVKQCFKKKKKTKLQHEPLKISTKYTKSSLPSVESETQLALLALESFWLYCQVVSKRRKNSNKNETVIFNFVKTARNVQTAPFFVSIINVHMLLISFFHLKCYPIFNTDWVWCSCSHLWVSGRPNLKLRNLRPPSLLGLFWVYLLLSQSFFFAWTLISQNLKRSQRCIPKKGYFFLNLLLCSL